MKYTTKILLEAKNNRPGEVRIRFRIRWSGNVVQFLVPYTVNIEKWSYETNRCKPNTTHGKHKIIANVINKELQLYEDITQSIFDNYYKLRQEPEPDKLKSEFLKLIGKDIKNESTTVSFFSVYDEFTRTQGVINSWSIETYTKFNSLKKHLLNYDHEFSFEQITGDKSQENLMRFISYLQSKEAMLLTNKNATIGHRNSTTAKNIDFIKWFLRWAANKNYYNGTLHNTFKPKLKGTDGNSNTIIFLEWNELHHLLNFDFRTEILKQKNDNDRNTLIKIQSIENVRDVFCFCCFTSLRYSDVAKLKRTDVKSDHIKIVTKKTADGLRIELNKYAISILDKYKNINFKRGLALPITSNSTMNEQLKEMAKLAGFDEEIRITYYIGSQRYEEVYPKWELITTHCGRRTFIVNSLYIGIPAEVVMQWTGHADYESMKPYIKIVDELKRESMNKFNTAETSDK